MFLVVCYKKLMFQCVISFFLIYIKDISKAFKNAVAKLFADDTNIFIFHKTEDALFKIASKKLESLENWL